MGRQSINKLDRFVERSIYRYQRPGYQNRLRHDLECPDLQYAPIVEGNPSAAEDETCSTTYRQMTRLQQLAHPIRRLSLAEVQAASEGDKPSFQTEYHEMTDYQSNIRRYLRRSSTESWSEDDVNMAQYCRLARESPRPKSARRRLKKAVTPPFLQAREQEQPTQNSLSRSRSACMSSESNASSSPAQEESESDGTISCSYGTQSLPWKSHIRFGRTESKKWCWDRSVDSNAAWLLAGCPPKSRDVTYQSKHEDDLFKRKPTNRSYEETQSYGPPQDHPNSMDQIRKRWNDSYESLNKHRLPSYNRSCSLLREYSAGCKSSMKILMEYEG